MQMRTHSKFLAVAFALCAGLFLALAPDVAHAATPAVGFFGDGSLADLLTLAGPTIAGLRADIDALTRSAEQKLAELKDDTPEADQTRIESEHDAILADIEARRSQLAEQLERVEAERVRAAGDQQTRASIDGAVTEALGRERQRVAEIQAIATRAGMGAEAVQAAIAGNVTVAAFRNSAFDHVLDNRPTDTRRVERVGQDETQTRRDAITSALMHRANPRLELSEPGREFRGMTLLELARDCLEASGERVRGLGRTEIAARAFHSTSDFPFILANVANNSLRAAYAAYPRTFMPFCRQVSAPDFKEMYRAQLGEAPQLEKVNDKGEFKRGTIKEGRESIKVDTYGKVVGITRQTIINDDLGAFTRIPAMFGTSAATLESDIVWALITGNVVMGDGVALFHTATHKNLVASGAALSVAAISAARVLMRKQKGLDGKTHLSITPRFLLVPTELETTAEQILNTLITPEQPANGVPASIRGLQPIVEPRLSDASATAFYLAADPSTVDTIEYAFLEGQEGVYTETRQGFDVDGLEVKARLDFGAAAIDWRGLSKNPGA